MQTFSGGTPAMVIGRRMNVDVKSVDFYNLHLPSSVQQAAEQHGKLHNADAEDYFFIRRNLFPWHRVPDIAIGRKAYDNFIVATGIMNNVSVVDATETLTALHQTDDDGNRAGHSNPENDINVRAIGRFNFRRGATSASQYCSRSYVEYTLDSKVNKIGIYRREDYRLLTVDNND